MIPRSLIFALTAAVLASVSALRAEGAMMACIESMAGADEGDQAANPFDRHGEHGGEETLAEQTALPGSSSSGATPPTGGSLSPILAASLDCPLDLLAAHQISTRLDLECSLLFPNPPPSGLLRPPRAALRV